MHRQTFAEINLANLKDNLALAKSLLPVGGRLMPVIKANGYGHGILEVARSLPGEILCVAIMDEALTLRRKGIQSSIVVLEGFSSPEELAEAILQKFIVVIHNDEQLRSLENYSRSAVVQDDPLSVWIKVNTGMNRLGFPPVQARNALTALIAYQNVKIEGFMTHFATADELDSECFDSQKATFESVVESARSTFSEMTLFASAANSAAILSSPSVHYDLCRPGIMLYGASPFENKSASSIGLKPVMNFYSTIIAVQSLSVGEGVGYGQRWRAERPSRIAIVAAGYADGYPRHAIDGTPVSVKGVEVPLVGKVSMDMLTIDITDQSDVKVGDEVQLWGDQVSVDRVASCSGTIGYELLTSVTSRVPRRYIESV
jgi:alanine racemase